MEKAKLIELRALYEEWNTIASRIKEYLRKAEEEFPHNARPYYISHIHSFYMEVKGLEKYYNDALNHARNILEPLGIERELLPSFILFPTHGAVELLPYRLCDEGEATILYEGETIAILKQMERECNKMLEIIKGIISEVSLSMEKEAELKSIEDGLKEKIEPVFPILAGDCLMGIENLRRGDFLGSALICGRIIAYITDKIKGQIPRISEKKPEEQWRTVVDFLKGKKVLEGKEGERVLDAMKLFRNKFAHKAGIYPSIGETILIISGTYFLLERIVDNKEEFRFLTS